MACDVKVVLVREEVSLEGERVLIVGHFVFSAGGSHLALLSLLDAHPSSVGRILSSAAWRMLIGRRAGLSSPSFHC